MTLYETLTIITLVITAVIILIQTGIAVKSFTADHVRRKREATIDYMNQIRPQYREMNKELIQKLGGGAIDDTKINMMLQDTDLYDKVKDMLGLFEHLAVGVNADVFDIGLLNLMSGGFLITIYDRYLLYFERRRRESNNPRLYEEYNKLVDKLKYLRGE